MTSKGAEGGQSWAGLVSISAKAKANNVIMFNSLAYRLAPRLASRSVTSVVLLTDIYDIIRRKMMLLQGVTKPTATPVSGAQPQRNSTPQSFLPAVISFALQAAKICLIVRKPVPCLYFPLSIPPPSISHTLLNICQTVIKTYLLYRCPGCLCLCLRLWLGFARTKAQLNVNYASSLSFRKVELFLLISGVLIVLGFFQSL